MAGNNAGNVGLNEMPEEIIVSIFGYLYAIQLYNLTFVNTRFNNIINTFYFNYDFNKEYTHSIKKYVKNYWASITKPLSTLQSRSSISDYLYSQNNFISSKDDSEQEEGRTKLAKIENGQRIFLENSHFKECFRQLNILLRVIF